MHACIAVRVLNSCAFSLICIDTIIIANLMQDQLNDYECFCQEGYFGHNCEYINITDYCLPQPCQNGANCSNLLKDYQCNCSQGFDVRM